MLLYMKFRNFHPIIVTLCSPKLVGGIFEALKKTSSGVRSSHALYGKEHNFNNYYLT